MDLSLRKLQAHIASSVFSVYTELRIDIEPKKKNSDSNITVIEYNKYLTQLGNIARISKKAKLRRRSSI